MSRSETITALTTLAAELGTAVSGDPLDELVTSPEEPVRVALERTSRTGTEVVVTLYPGDGEEEGVTVDGTVSLEVPREDVPAVVRALLTREGAFLVPTGERHGTATALVSSLGAVGELVVRAGDREHRAQVPQTGMLGAGEGSLFAWATSLPHLPA